MPETQNIERHLFRMIHIDSLENTLKDGVNAPNYKFDSTYTNIGDEALIAQRGEFTVPIEPGGTLSDYVPFYFGGHSPMLLNIKTGFRGITKRNQSEIIFLCTHIKVIVDNGLEFCFTDGHAKDRLTTYYNQLSDLTQIDWLLAESSYWADTEDDPDRMRRKQAEFLVKNHVPVSCIAGIIVHDEEAAVKVKEIMERAGVQLPVHVDKSHKYYYND